MKNDTSLFAISYPLVREILLVLAPIMSLLIRPSADDGHANTAAPESQVPRF